MKFMDVNVEPGAASPEGLSMRFKLAGEPRAVRVLPYESEQGLAGRWRVAAVDDDESTEGAPATAVPVEDSSDGTAWLIVGGRAGLRLEHVESHVVAREPYLVLAIGTRLD